MGYGRVKVVITGYYTLPVEGSELMNIAYSSAFTHDEAVQEDRGIIANGGASAYDVLEWIEEDPEIVLELEK